MIKDIDNNKIIVSSKFPFSKQDFKYFINYKGFEKTRTLSIFRLQTIIYKRNFDENKSICVLIKEEKKFIRDMGILENVSNMIRNKFNSEVIYSKKHLKAETIKHRMKLSMFICTNNTY